MVTVRHFVYRSSMLGESQAEEFRKRVEFATLDRFQGYQNAIDGQLKDVACELVEFHIVMLAGAVGDEIGRRIQQETLGHRDCKGDPL